LTALDSKFFTSITFADVSKTFDRVWIGLLLKLERYVIKGLKAILLCGPAVFYHTLLLQKLVNRRPREHQLLNHLTQINASLIATFCYLLVR
jgi:hypothetical protein